MANEMAQAYKRVLGRKSSAHHVRVEAEVDEDCQCGDSDLSTDIGIPATNIVNLCCVYNVLDTILQVTLTLTAPSAVVIMAAVVCDSNASGRIDIQRPIGTSVVDQENIITFGGELCNAEPYLWELEACEELPAGTYTWTLFATETVGRIYAAWIKARAVT